VSWKPIDRNSSTAANDAEPLLSGAIREKIKGFFPRYETKRAALLPALHIVQEACGHISHPAMIEVAELLEIHPSDVLDVVSFYTHFCDHPKGQKTLLVCRSLSCELMGGDAVLNKIKDTLAVGEHGTTEDGRYTLMTEECLAACDMAPCMLINERMVGNLTADGVSAVLDDPDNDRLPIPRNALFDPPQQGARAGQGSTSDVQEMIDAD
jgi:NADH-quinone oxidoreductase subunit E